ncbi:hypothetical protein M426DRAFT_323624 [Hypoxylon sp. CI-4A]|nr:hypothetical protein M426DRAFT_323624 [Hypoxylon sp. CI-4A]
MVSETAPAPRSLESLPARPPTPPREKKQEVDSSKPGLSNQPVDIRLNNLHTPPSHSPDYPDTTNPSTRRSRKKVGFLAQAEYQDAPTYSNKENVRKQSTPASAPSSGTSLKPVKSILKQSSSPLPRNPLEYSVDGDGTSGQINIVTMLDSTIQQLAGADRVSKIDSYMMLSRALKTSSNLPDRIALQDKMSLLMQFIQRDVTAKDPEGKIDSSMANHALSLLCTFFAFPAIASTLSSDFGIFIIDHAIRSFDEPSTPKDIVRHLMRVVALQDFSAKVMSSDRVGRLINSLHNIEDNVKGKSIVMSRIYIYQKLIKQSKTYMTSHSDWLLDLFTDMVSDIKEIRAAAISLGLEVGFTIAKEKSFSKRAMEVLQMQAGEAKYIEYYVSRLMGMVAKKTDSASVPQIWSVVLLLLRCPVERWEFFSPWLEVIQRCFNSGDFNTRLEANYAWNRLVYSLHLNESSFSKTLGTVCQPFISQLRRKRGNSKQVDELRKAVIGGICNLYYYAFRPNLSAAHVDNYWDACVRPLMQRLVSAETDSKQSGEPVTSTASSTSSSTSLFSTSENLTHATLILTGLLDSSTTRVWKEDRVAENSMVKPDELPALDPKWARRNAARVFTIVEPILQETFLDLADPKSASYRLWHAFVSSVAAAASKEVKVSADTATFMAHAFSVLARIWIRGLDQEDIEPDSQRNFLDATQVYISMMVESLGVLPFTEKLLSLNNQNSFVPVATPSHRSGKGSGLVRTPLHHLFSVLSTVPPNIPDDEALSDLIRIVFDPFIIARSSANAKMDLARELMQTLPANVFLPYGPWVLLSDVLFLSLDSSQSSYLTTTSGSDPTTIGHEYREVVKHLERGIKFTPNLPWDHWHTLFQQLVTRATTEVGEAGCAIAVVEPLAKCILEFISVPRDNTIPYNSLKGSLELITTAKQPRDQQALDAARRRLWGTPIAGSRSASFDPFDSLYGLINFLLETSYAHIDQYDQDEVIVPLLTEAASFLTRCSSPLVFKSLIQLQHSISIWVQDADAQYSSTQSSKVSDAVKVLWDRICSLLPNGDYLEHLQLDAIEELLCSAFQSKHRHIVNTVSAMWNRSFDKVEEIQYPEKLKEVLMSIHSYVDIVLPGLDLSSYESSGQEPNFIDSQIDLDEPAPSSSRSRRQTRSGGTPSGRVASPGSVQLSLQPNRQSEITPVSSRRRSNRHSTTPRPRHDDSQIQFQPIESSPARNALESQVLTDRQKEVRERQREEAAIFQHMGTNAEKRKSARLASRNSEQVKTPQQVRDATPPPNRSLEDYVSSTPTPRRGQASIIYDDQEMTDDITSSPPEPRRNLLAEMKPRSRVNTSFPDFPIPSSPVSGSPVPKQPSALVNVINVEQGDLENNVEDEPMLDPMDHDEPDEVATPSPEEVMHDLKDQESYAANAPKQPETPQQIISLDKPAESSPRSDPEVFMDALASPVAQAPRALRSNTVLEDPQSAQSEPAASSPKDDSFDVSAADERSYVRLVVELDSRKCNPTPKYGSESPEKHQEIKPTPDEDITVKASSKRSRTKSKKDDSIQLSQVDSASTPKTMGTPSSSKKSKKKRKRNAEKSQEPGSSHKKRKHVKNIEAEAEVVPSSQVSEYSSAEAADILDAGIREEMELDPDKSVNSQGPTTPEPAAIEPEQPDSSPVEFEDSLVERESDTEAVNLQIFTEASQQTEVGPTPPEGLVTDDLPLIDDDTEMIGQGVEVEEAVIVEEAEAVAEPSQVEEEPVVEKSAAERIMNALKNGLEGLRTATLTRDEVNRIEDMFFDIKRELYQAEGRSRH